MEYECDTCGEEFDPEDDVQSQFALIDEEGGEHVCALCNSDFA